MLGQWASYDKYSIHDISTATTAMKKKKKINEKIMAFDHLYMCFTKSPFNNPTKYILSEKKTFGGPSAVPSLKTGLSRQTEWYRGFRYISWSRPMIREITSWFNQIWQLGRLENGLCAHRSTVASLAFEPLAFGWKPQHDECSSLATRATYGL